MGTFSLKPRLAAESVRRPTGWEGLSNAVLLQDAHWFTRIRWVVALVFAGFGAMATLAPGTLSAVGVRPPVLWPWALAGTVALVNLTMVKWLRRMFSNTTRRRIATCIWTQITADLLVLTVLVYFVGPADTVIPFAYLFHIALACIFFGRRESVLVVLLSGSLYLSVVTLEMAGRLPSRSILAHSLSRPPDVSALITTAGPTVFVWLVVWHLVSTISESVRRRDRELDAANTRLLKADEEKNLQVLRVTHDLKAPFAGIENNIQMLRFAHWEGCSDEVREILRKIEARGATLRARIGDILTLGNLRSNAGTTSAFAPVQLAPLLRAAVQDVRGVADRRHVSICLNDSEATVRSDARQLKILFLNLLTNAASYSAEGGRSVDVVIQRLEPIRVRVTDHGIGISDKALPHIFEDYYRSTEAAQANAQGTGLGLAIVRQIAQNLGLTVNVNSTEGEGTAFEVVFPQEKIGPP